jgi:NitT/TauT family transport system substrate-binding protein
MPRRAFLAGIAAAWLADIRLASSAQPTKVTFAGAAAVARPDQGFMFLGIPAGFYNTLAIDADFVTIAGSAAAIQLLTSGQVQLAHVGMMELLAAKQRMPRLPVKAVYLQEWGSGYEIVLPSESRLQEVADLRGRRVGVLSIASGAVPFVKAMLRHAGVDPASVELLPVGAGAQALAALRNQQVDALSLFRGSHAALENLGVALRYLTAPLPSSVLAVNEPFLNRNRAGVVGALQGVVLNTVYMETSATAAVKRYWDLFGKPGGNEDLALRDNAHLIKRSAELWKQLGDPHPWGELGDDSWRKLIDYMGPEGGIKLSNAELAAVYTNELIEDVNRVDVAAAIKAAQQA